MRGAALLALAALPLLPFVLSGCESSAAKSARLAKEGRKGLRVKAFQVGRANAEVRPVASAVLHDSQGDAVAVTFRNVSGTGQAGVPIAIDMVGARGRSVFRNDDAGLEAPLRSVASVPAHGEVTWVNDQVVPSAPARRVKVKVGVGRPLRGPLPPLELSPPHLNVDPVSGVEATGTIVNRSRVEQRALVVYCVARRAGRIVAAGRGQIERLKVGPKRVTYHVFFIGDPRGGQLSVYAPPTVIP